MNAALPRVVVLSTGGTIAGRGASPMNLTDYKAGSLAGEDLVNAVPELRQYAQIAVEQVSNIGSSNMTIAIWHKLAARIDELYSSDKALSGIVITHGTSTIEETAYFLNLTVRHDRPVVLVGAQRPATAISADGPLNLVSAVRTAACADSCGRGVLVVLNDEINAARDVTKSNTYRAETFRSGELGFLGYVDEDRVVYYRRPEKRHTAHSEFALTGIDILPAVEIVYCSTESNAPVVVEALEKAGVRGIVFASTGAGSLSDRERDAVRQSAAAGRGTVFVRSTRVANGRVLARTAFDQLGIVAADNLSPQKARILLMLALAGKNDVAAIRRIFSEY